MLRRKEQNEAHGELVNALVPFCDCSLFNGLAGFCDDNRGAHCAAGLAVDEDTGGRRWKIWMRWLPSSTT